MEQINYTILLRSILWIYCLCIGLTLQAQQVDIAKTVSNTTPNPEETFDFILDCNCISTTTHCDNVVLTDVLPATVEFLSVAAPTGASASYDSDTHTLTVTFNDPNATNGIDAGNSKQIVVTVFFPNGSLTGAIADNTADITSTNAGSDSSTASATAQNGNTPTTGVATEKEFTGGGSDDVIGGGISYNINHGTLGLESVDNYTVYDTIPPQLALTRIENADFAGTNQDVRLFYQTNQSTPGVWIEWTDAGNPIFNTCCDEYVKVEDLGLNANEYITMIRFDYGTLPGDGSFYIGSDSNDKIRISADIIDPDMNGDPVNVGDQFYNCSYVEGDIGGTTYSDRSCEGPANVIEPFSNLFTTKWASGGTTKVVGDTIHWNIGLIVPGTMPVDSTVSGIVMIDILPPGVSIVNWTIDDDTENQDWIAAGSPAPQYDVIPNYDGLGNTLYRWIWDDAYGNNFTITPVTGESGILYIRYDMVIESGMPAGNYENEFYFSVDDPADYYCNVEAGADFEITDDLDLDLDGDNTDALCGEDNSFTVQIPSTGAGIDAIKWVKGQCDADWTRFPEVGQTVPGGLADYQLVITNPNATPITNFVVIDILPFIGDKGVLDPQDRLSEWRPNLAGSVTAPAGITVEYSTETNPCRDEMENPDDGIPNNFPSGCTVANWSTTPPANITAVQSLRFDFGSLVLNQGESVTLEWPMRAPVTAPTTGEVAWNSFAWKAEREDNGNPLLPAEPLKVGIQLKNPAPAYYGDLVWHDLDEDGLQDAGEPGVDGVTVTLYEDTNGNGIAEPGTDTQVSFTVTANGGLYAFTNLAPGDYFAVFSNLPTDFVISPSLVGGDSTIDSEGLTTAVTTLDADEEDYTWDLGIYNNSAPVCGLNIDNVVVGACVDVGGGNFRATVDVTLSWMIDPPGEDIIVMIGDSIQTIDVTGGLTSPQTVQFTMPADGSTGNLISAHFQGGVCADTDGDSYDAPSCASSVCALNISNIITNCTDNGNNTFTSDIDVELTWKAAPSGEDILVTFDGGMTQIIPAGTASPQTVTFSGINSDGTTTEHIIAAAFASSTDCADTSFLACNDLLACPANLGSNAGEICNSLNVDEVGGTVFEDWDYDGAMDGMDTLGVQGVKVYLVDDCNGTIDSTYTDSDGNYLFSGLSGSETYRIEFVLPEAISCWACPSLTGVDNGSNIQFVQAGECAGFAIASPSDYCDENPALITACYTNGEALQANGATSWNLDALIKFDYDIFGEHDDAFYTHPTSLGTIDPLGTVWGLSYNKHTDTIYASAFLKRHSGFGVLGPGGIYSIHKDGGVTNWLDLTGLGINVGEDPRVTSGVPLPTGPDDASYDTLAYKLVGKMSLGDMDISDDGTTLYVMNLYDRELVEIDILTQSVNAQYPIPDPGCWNSATGSSSPNDRRPWAVKVYRNKVYIGVTCSAEASQQVDDMWAYIMLLDKSSGRFSTVYDFPLNYERRYAFATEDNEGINPVVECPAEWQPWSETWNTCDLNGNHSQPQPLLSDIEIEEDEDFIIAIMDRFGHMSGNENLSPDMNDNNTYWGITAGDILKISVENGSYTLEHNATSAENTTLGVGNNQGPGTLTGTSYSPPSGEFFFEDYFTAFYSPGVNGNEILIHDEIILGGLALLPGSDEVALTVYDSYLGNANDNNWDEGGIHWYGRTTGEVTRRYEVYEDAQPYFAKAGGLGDIELICGLAPTEIGNYVWFDENENGIQDACELPLDSVIVTLYNDACEIVAIDTTDSNGQYYFNDAKVADYTTQSDTTLLIDSIYHIVISGAVGGTYDNITGILDIAGTTYNLTDIDLGTSDRIDSDGNAAGTACGSVTDYPFVTTVPLVSGCADHNYDFGFKRIPCALNITNVSTGVCDPATNTHTLDVEVTWSDAPTGELIEVTTGGTTLTIDPTTETSPATVQFTVPADGSTGNAISAAFDGGTCSDTDGDTYDAQSSCENACALTFPFPGFSIDTLDDNCSWLDYDLAANMILIDNGDGTMTIAGDLINGVDADFDACTTNPCGPDDGWQLNITLSDKKTWAEWSTTDLGGGVMGDVKLNAACEGIGLEDNIDYWDAVGTLIGTGCNAGQTISIDGPQAPYRLQIGYGANSNDSDCTQFSLSTWFDLTKNGQSMKGDIYARLDESCYDSTCDLTINSITPTTCDPSDNTYDVTANISWSNAPANDSIFLDLGGLRTRYYVPSTSSGTVNYTFNDVYSDGNMIELLANFTTDVACIDSMEYQAPASCVNCELTINSISTPTCDPTDNLYDITVNVSWIEPPANDSIFIDLGNGLRTNYYTPTTTSGSVNFNFLDLYSDGSTLSIKTNFTTDIACKDSTGYTAPVACAPCDLTINSITPNACDPADNLYDVVINISWSQTPANDSIYIDLGGLNDAYYVPTTSSGSVNFTFNDVNSDGQTYTVNANFTTDNTCSDSMDYTAPVACAPCDLTINSVTPNACDPADNLYDVVVNISWSQAPVNDSIYIDLGGLNDAYYVPTTSSGSVNFTFNDVNSDGQTYTVNANFTTDNTCSNSMDYTAPVACAPCDLTINSVTPNACDPADNLYDVVINISWSQAPVNDSIYIDLGGLNDAYYVPTTSSGSVNFTFNDVNSDGQTYTVNANFTTDNTCSNSMDYTAPVACAPCDLTINSVTPNACDPANNLYDVVINISWSQTPANDSIYIDLGGLNNAYYVPTTSSGSVNFTFNDVNSDGQTYTVNANFTTDNTCSDSMDYTAPVACPDCPPIKCLPVIIIKAD